MVIAARFKGRCRVCSGTIARGERIDWTKGDGAAHVACTPEGRAAKADSDRANGRTVVGPCWECKAEGGKFRNEGAFSPVRCDECQAKRTCEHCGKRREMWNGALRCMSCCPTCHGPMSAAYARKGYQCDGCANLAEGVGYAF